MKKLGLHEMTTVDLIKKSRIRLCFQTPNNPVYCVNTRTEYLSIFDLHPFREILPFDENSILVNPKDYYDKKSCNVFPSDLRRTLFEEGYTLGTIWDLVYQYITNPKIKKDLREGCKIVSLSDRINLWSDWGDYPELTMENGVVFMDFKTASAFSKRDKIKIDGKMVPVPYKILVYKNQP